jgi:transposase
MSTLFTQDPRAAVNDGLSGGLHTLADVVVSDPPSYAAVVWARRHRVRLECLQDAGALDWHRAAQTARGRPPKEGAAVGPNPTDRGRLGTKRHLVTDAQGTSLGVTLSGVNRNDSRMLAAAPDGVLGMRGRHRERTRCRSAKLHADKGHDHRRCRRECPVRGIQARITRRAIESSTRLGRHGWVVERTFAWLARFRRLTVRYERRADPLLCSRRHWRNS